MKRQFPIALAMLLLNALSASADGEAIFNADGPMVEPQRKALIMVMPDMAEKMIGGVDLHANLPGSDELGLGVRGQVMVFKTRSLAVSVEGIAEGHSVDGQGIFDLADGWGGGARVHLPLVSDGHNDALMVSPGVDFIFVQPGNHTGWFSAATPYSRVYLIGTNVDIAYLHLFFSHLGIQVGASAGMEVSLGGIDGQHQETRGKVYKRFGLFGGIVF